MSSGGPVCVKGFKGMDYCELCGFPQATLERVKWSERGLVALRKPWTRLVALEHQELAEILEGLQPELGGDFSARLQEMARENTRDTLSSEMSRLRRRLVGALASRSGMADLLQNAGLYGTGQLDLLEVEAPESLSVRVRHPYHPDLYAGDLLGLWEALFGVKGVVTVESCGGHVFKIRIAANPKERETLPPAVKTDAKPHKPKKQRKEAFCKSCGAREFGVPITSGGQAGIFGADKGFWVFMPVSTLRGILGQLDQDDPAGEANLKAIAAGRALAQLQGSIPGAAGVKEMGLSQSFLTSLVSLGWANSMRLAEKEYLMEVSMDNPVSPALIAGKLEGLYEYVNHEKPVSEVINLGSGRSRISVGPEIFAPVMNLTSVLARYPDLRRYPASFIPF